jgi:hypothetical protein
MVRFGTINGDSNTQKIEYIQRVTQFRMLLIDESGHSQAMILIVTDLLLRDCTLVRPCCGYFGSCDIRLSLQVAADDPFTQI